MPRKANILDKDFIISRCIIDEKSGCWNWAMSRTSQNQNGKTMLKYGRTEHCGKKYMAHRLSYEIFLGEIPNGDQVLHQCDNMACCNPEHLFLGSQLDNMRDMASNRHVFSKIMEKDIPEILRLRSEGRTQSEIAKIFGVHPSTISNRTRHLEPPQA